MASDSIAIRYVTDGDKEEWTRLWLGFRAHYDIPIPDGLGDANFKRIMDDSVDMWSAFAVDTSRDDKPIGLVNWVSRPSTWDLTDIVYLHDLYVDENERVRGVGRKLIEFVYSEADKRGTPLVYWTTDHYNHRAQLLYTKVAKKTSKVIYEREL
ncbi:GNAT family N-acetyltransferase KNAG_0B02050 [Huiozyma naganishii CBS 8797]|uniref:N-acetyltransferase domain-containing protein n=1 Tax=Huiozyma naganishii (strain ATCC MYA-139 / BCRC 22969 / CBS 8797 / KCTC 17520 / NBRC 10181 / NCYC 3082 / Yp74L-3) TaxID=1071383 RepID=J7RUV3_HUIN7|nr:hypothetical protein KNAG_0B02050 [Kazachstania naganishii CBS 8797]CCK68647.1 hypothetical protein KNAG_0B02050 [Kazachstania naganishii CBS 8797]